MVDSNVVFLLWLCSLNRQKILFSGLTTCSVYNVYQLILIIINEFYHVFSVVYFLFADSNTNMDFCGSPLFLFLDMNQQTKTAVDFWSHYALDFCSHYALDFCSHYALDVGLNVLISAENWELVSFLKRRGRGHGEGRGSTKKRTDAVRLNGLWHCGSWSFRPGSSSRLRRDYIRRLLFEESNWLQVFWRFGCNAKLSQSNMSALIVF